MKKVLLLFAIAFAFITSSCSEDAPAMPEKQTYRDSALKIDTINLYKVFDDLDKLNAQYKVSTHVSRGGGSYGYFISKADEAGAFVGTGIGKKIGSAIGSRFGARGIGSFLGGLVGEKLGYEASSALARKFFGCGGIIVRPNNLWDSNIKVTQVLGEYYADCKLSENKVEISMLNEIGSIGDIEDPGDCTGGGLVLLPDAKAVIAKCDSLGYFHNAMMAHLEIDADKYIENGKPDVERINEVIISEMKKLGFDVYGILDDEEFKAQMMEMQSLFGYMAFTAYGSKTIDEYVNLQCLCMSTNYELAEEEIAIYKNFISEISKTCIGMTEIEIHDYAAQLNTLILEAEVSSEIRADLALGANAVINSALCWR